MTRSSYAIRFVRLRSLVAACCLLAAAHGHAQQADRRIALVIGNADYKSAPLKNPVNDARAVAQTPVPNEKTQVALAQPSEIVKSEPRNIALAGDRWSYVLLLNGKRRVDTISVTVTSAEVDRIEERITREAFRTFGAMRSFKAGFDPHAQLKETELPGGFYLVEFSPYLEATEALAVGKRWEDIPAQLTFSGVGLSRVQTVVTIEVVAQERIRLPAGEFDTVRVEVWTPQVNFSVKHASLRLTYWYSPALQRTVKISRRQSCSHATDNFEDVLELASFQLAK